MIFFCIKFEIVSWIENLYTLHTYSRPKALTYIPRNEGVPPQDAPNANKFNSFGAKHGSELTISSIQHKLAANIFIFILLYVFFSHHTTNSLHIVQKLVLHHWVNKVCHWNRGDSLRPILGWPRLWRFTTIF